jgi:hypothetical protein
VVTNSSSKYRENAELKKVVVELTLDDRMLRNVYNFSITFD